MNHLKSASRLLVHLLVLALYVPSAFGQGRTAKELFADAMNGDREALRQIVVLGNAGNVEAQVIIGDIYYRSDTGFPKDSVQAVFWWRKAAEQGQTNAQFNLAAMYATGDGVPKDLVMAYKWVTLAAEQGHADAQFHLAAMYATGDGVPRDLVIAYKWVTLATAQGNTVAKEVRDVLEKEMTAAQITEARKLSGEWKPKK